jgi:hypothetical protein
VLHHRLFLALVSFCFLWNGSGLFAQEEVTPINTHRLTEWYEKRGLTPPQDLVTPAQSVVVPNQLLSPSNEPDVRVFPSSNPQTENSIAVNHANPQQLMISTNGTATSTGQTWFFSTNGGANWFGSETAPNNSANLGDPVALFNYSGAIAYWVTLRSPSGIGICRTTNLGTTWTTMVNADLNNSSGDDKEHAMADLSGVYPNNVYIAWTDFNVVQIGSRVVVARSTDNGTTWSARSTLSTGNDAGQGVNLATGPNGEVYCAMASYTNGNLPEGGIRFARSTDGGATWSAAGLAFTISGIRTSSQGIAAFGNTRVNSFPSMGVDRSSGSRRGWIYVTYADRNTGDADVYLRRSTDGGTSWSAAIRVNGDVVGNGKQQWFPSIAVDPANGNLSIGYYSQDSTGSNLLTNRYIAYSTDGGTTFDRFVVSDVRFTPTPLSGFAAGYMGDYYETAASGGKAWACWSDNRSGQFQAYVSRATYTSTITVTAPVGGESWAAGSSQTISWNSSGVSGDVKIELSRNGGTTFPEVLFASTANTGSVVWTVTAPASSTCRVRISSVSDTSVRDSSHANFTIVQPTITVTSPNGGEIWAIGSQQNVTWTSTNLPGSIKIELSTNGGSTFPTVIAASTTNDGAETWTVSGPVSSTARIRISSISIPSLADTSNANFSMVQPSITVTSPNGGESWAIGSSHAITWTSANLTGSVRIELSTDGGLSFPTVIAASTPNDGTEPWTVSGAPTSTAKVRISSLVVQSLADTSDAVFDIVQPAIVLITPNGGQVWEIGSVQTFMWSSQGITGPVKIELSRNGGVSYETLFGSTENDGMEEWVVTGPPTANGLVRVSSVANPSVQDVSNSPFTISPQFGAFARVHVRDGGMDADSMEFGTGAGATDGIDELFGEQELPPPPPVGAFDIRWQIAGTQGTKRDIRDTLGGSRQQVTYTGRMQPGPGGYPFHLRWDRLGLPSGGFTMRYQSEEGPVLVNMKQADSLVIADASVELFQVIYTIGDVVSSTAAGGWNVVSLPVRVGDRRRTAVFPTSVSNAFAYTPLGYASRDTLDYGVGYWLKFAMTQGLTVTGELITEDTIEVVQGWNIIGSISSPVVVTGIVQIPSGIVVSPYYGYSATGYAPASVLEPMKGYWVKVSQNGTLVLNTSRSHNRNPLDSFRNSSRLTGFRR